MTRDAAIASDAAIPMTSLDLPTRAHVPGTGSEPDWPPLEAAKATATSVTSEQTWADNWAYVYGFALIRAGFYWEAHEVWEPVWLACPPNSRERTLLRALIQFANAKLKCRMGRSRAAFRLINEAQSELAELRMTKGELFMGVNVSALVSELDVFAKRLTSVSIEGEFQNG